MGYVDPAKPRSVRGDVCAARSRAQFQIEGTQSTLEDVLQFELDEKGANLPKDIFEVVNYVNAMNYGVARLKDLPLCLRLIREIHGRLLQGVRGGEKNIGDFRRTQNWIGPAGCTLGDAAFVPPPVHEMHTALDNLEKFLHDAESFPVLIHCTSPTPSSRRFTPLSTATGESAGY